ncbi:hypothetical protein TWF696_007466 [Orbilia brochopaga]|uniref:Uncharacterized protein n=1 Tax=Orbilia brochopaga TaxID=3140254 RepID=A0AAV9UL61_9PEZI
MRPRLCFLTATGLASLATARYLPRPAEPAHSSEYDGQKNLFKRQMQDNVYNPFAPLTNPLNPPNINPQTLPNTNVQNAAPNTNINLADQVEDDIVQSGEGTPTFQGLNAIANPGGNEELPALGMASALGRLDLSGLVNGPNVIRPVVNAPVEIQAGQTDIVADRIRDPSVISQQIQAGEGGQDIQITEQIPLQISEQIQPQVTEQISEQVIEQLPQEGQLPGRIVEQVNNGEEYEYAPFIPDPTEPDWYQFPGLTRNPYWGGRMEPPSPQSLPLTRPLTRRPPNEPKYSPCGRRMGYILNRSVWLGTGEVASEDIAPFRGIIEPGDEVAEEPVYLDDDWELNWTEEEIRECERALRLEALGIIEIPEEGSTDDDAMFQSAVEPTAELEAQINADREEIQRIFNQEEPMSLGVIREVERENTDVSDEANVSTGSDRNIDDIVAELERPEINLNRVLEPNYIAPPRRVANEVEEEEKANPNNPNARTTNQDQFTYLSNLNNAQQGGIGRPKKSRIGRVTSFLRGLPSEAQSGFRSTFNRITGRRRPNQQAVTIPNLDTDPFRPGANDVSVITDSYNAPVLNFGNLEPSEDDDFRTYY